MRVGIRARARLPLVLIFAAAVVLTGCRSQTPPPTREVDVWKPVGTWSGHGNLQTETFTSDTGGFRVTWETRNEQPPGAGVFRVIFHSNDSGRPIIDAVDVHGVGHATTEVADIVRWYYVTVESANVDWSMTIDERLRLQLTP
jgi:hypothetical protein